MYSNSFSIIFTSLFSLLFSFFSEQRISKNQNLQVTHRKKKQKLESAKKPAVGASLDGISQERNGK